MTQHFGSAWCAGRPDAAALLEPEHLRPDRWAARPAAAARQLDPPLTQALRAANAGRDDPAVSRQLERLAGPVAFVVTGQQVGLFGGPLYTIVKALAAVRWARRLEAASGAAVLPLFWLQTEDHDFTEVARWRGPGADGSVVDVTLSDEPQLQRTPLGERRLPDEIEPRVTEVLRRAATGIDRDRVQAWIRSAYRPGRSFAEAFGHLVSEVLRGLGLLFFDPRHPNASAAARPVFDAALRYRSELHEGLRWRARAIERAGFEAPVPIRHEALVFVQPDGRSGPRFRPTGSGSSWRLSGLGMRIDDATMRAWLADDPGRFSTSALLRPIVQDVLLPTAAQVAGPGEISYLAQCAPLWAHFGVRPGILVPRPRVRLIEPWARRAMARWALGPDDVRASLDATLDRMAPPDGPEPDSVRAAFRDAWARTSQCTEPLGDDVQPARRVLDRRVERAVDQFAAKYGRIRRRRDRDRTAAAQRLVQAFYPAGFPQERYFGVIPFLARYGSRYVIERLSSAVDGDGPEPRNVDL